MKLTTFYKIVFLWFIGIVSILLFCCDRSYSQATVSDNEQHHYHDYNQYNLQDSLKDSGMVRYFNVTASDGKMSRVDSVSDPGSAWVGWMSDAYAYFQGTQNPNKTGYFNPQFSGEVTKTGGSGTEPAKYEWTIHNAGYHIVRIQIDESIPAIIVKDDNQCQSDRTKIVFECSAKLMGHTSNLPPTITQKTVTLSNTGVGKVKFGHTQNSLNSESLNITLVPYQATKFYVAGSSPSSTMNDAEITATCDGQVVYKKDNLTVLWVDLALRNSGDISSNNASKPAILATFGNETVLGNAILVRPLISNPNIIAAYHFFFFYEIHGEVSPSNFNQNIRIIRDVDGSVCMNGFSQYYRKWTFKNSIPGDGDGNDSSTGPTLDDVPPDIYNFDGPGFLIENNIGEYKASRANFRVHAMFNHIRCSSILEFSIKTNAEIKSNGDITRSNTDGWSNQHIPLNIGNSYEHLQ
ncbi:MAG: hypothetical protein LBG58_02875 [Planctomycetaceae bacterium]|jgi:hypothetical protein|nr:hypothetical protein [Planctomycetaceae bacterium]